MDIINFCLDFIMTKIVVLLSNFIAGGKIMVKRQHRVTSIALTMLLVLGMLMVGAVNVSTTAKAAGGDVIYFVKPASWGTPKLGDTILLCMGRQRGGSSAVARAADGKSGRGGRRICIYAAR